MLSVFLIRLEVSLLIQAGRALEWIRSWTIT